MDAKTFVEKIKNDVQKGEVISLEQLKDLAQIQSLDLKEVVKEGLKQSLFPNMVEVKPIQTNDEEFDKNSFFKYIFDL